MKIALIIFLIVIVTLAGGTIMFGQKIQGALSQLKPEPKATEVRLETTQPGQLVETVEAPGEIEPHTMVVIYAEVSTRIEALPFEEGDVVTKGDVIVRLDDRDLKAALASRNAQREENKYRIESERSRIAGLRSDLEYSQRTLARQQALYDSGDIALSLLDDANQRVLDIKTSIDASMHTISVMESSLAVAQANIARAERDLENTIIKAPMDGVITSLNVEVGEAVLGMVSNMGTRIMVIADLSRMIMKAKVPESDIAEVANGLNARIHLNAYPDEVFSGSVTRIALQRTTDPDGTGFFETEVELDLRGRELRSGLNANVDIEIASHEGLKVESQAIVQRIIEDLPEELKQDHPLIDRTKRTVSAVYRMVEGKSVFTPVKPGPSDLTHTLVLEGLNEGDLVVVGPYKVLEEIEHDERLRDINRPADTDKDTTEATEALVGAPTEALVGAPEEEPDVQANSGEATDETSAGAMQ